MITAIIIVRTVFQCHCKPSRYRDVSNCKSKFMPGLRNPREKTYERTLAPRCVQGMPGWRSGEVCWAMPKNGLAFARLRNV
eukprot:2684876-Amphidinium_carterae.1